MLNEFSTPMNWTTREPRLPHHEMPRNNPRLFELVQVRVLRAFCIRGERIEPGKLVELERHLAESLASIGKVQLR